MAAGKSLGQGIGWRPCGCIGRGLGQSETRKRKNRSVAPVGTSFGQSLGRKRLWDGRERFWDVGWFWPRSVRDLEVNGVDTLVGRSLRYKRRRYVVQVIGWRASVANGVGMLATTWVDRRRDVG